MLWIEVSHDHTVDELGLQQQLFNGLGQGVMHWYVPQLCHKCLRAHLRQHLRLPERSQLQSRHVWKRIVHLRSGNWLDWHEL